MKRYYVTYTYTHDGGRLMGSIHLEVKKYFKIIEVMEYIKSLPTYIGDKDSQIIISNFIELKKYESFGDL